MPRYEVIWKGGPKPPTFGQLHLGATFTMFSKTDHVSAAVYVKYSEKQAFTLSGTIVDLGWSQTVTPVEILSVTVRKLD